MEDLKRRAESTDDSSSDDGDLEEVPDLVSTSYHNTGSSATTAQNGFKDIEFSSAPPDTVQGFGHISEDEIKQQQHALRCIAREHRREQKEGQARLHMLHLQCLTSSLSQLNWYCSHHLLQHVAFSILPPGLVHHRSIAAILAWFRATFSVCVEKTESSVTNRLAAVQSRNDESIAVLDSDEEDITCTVKDKCKWPTSILKRMLMQIQFRVGRPMDIPPLFCLICRSLNINTRLAWSFQPLPRSLKRKQLSRSQKRQRKQNISSGQTWAKNGVAEAIEFEGHELSIIRQNLNDDCLHETLSDIWVEVHDVNDGWVPICPLFNVQGDPFEVASRCSGLIQYVVVADAHGQLKDVTQRYAANWLTKVQKLRVDDSWWNPTLKAAAKVYDRSDRDGDIDEIVDTAEDAQLAEAMLSRAIPTSLVDIKNHRLYILERFLKSDEVIHPDHKSPVGTVRGEAVFWRCHVHKVKSREAWLKEARSIKIGEKSVKLSKRRVTTAATTSHKAMSREEAEAATAAANAPVELFAEWQTTPYVPGRCKNGSVPKNSYGTVDLFQPSMLPAGGTHLPQRGIVRIAKKLGISYAPATTGFTFGKAGAKPIQEGIVVCTDMAEVVLSAYEEDLVMQEKVAEQKRIQRVLERWRSMVVKLAILSRLKSTN